MRQQIDVGLHLWTSFCEELNRDSADCSPDGKVHEHELIRRVIPLADACLHAQQICHANRAEVELHHSPTALACLSRIRGRGPLPAPNKPEPSRLPPARRPSWSWRFPAGVNVMERVCVCAGMLSYLESHVCNSLLNEGHILQRKLACPLR